MKNLALKKRTRGPNLHLMFKLHEIRSIYWFSGKSLKLLHQISDFKAKMQRSPRPVSAPPDPLAGFKGPTSKGRGGEGRGGEWRGEKGRGDGREGRERGREGPHQLGGPRSPKTR